VLVELRHCSASTMGSDRRDRSTVDDDRTDKSTLHRETRASDREGVYGVLGTGPVAGTSVARQSLDLELDHSRIPY
jgi:hypothetical protein